MNQQQLAAGNDALPQGVFAYTAPGQGQQYKWYDADITIKISPEDSSFTHMAAWLVELEAAKAVSFFAQRAVDRVYYCIAGGGFATLGTQRHAISAGSFIHVGRGVPFLLESPPEQGIRLAAASVPIAAEVRGDVFTAGARATAELEDAAKRRLLGVLDWYESTTFPAALRGPAYVLGPEGGESFWQAAPTNGYVTSKTSPRDSAVYHFSAAVQLVEPDAHVREHGHQRACELLVCVHGAGTARIDGGDELDFSSGAAVLLGPRAMHTLRNTGDDDFVLFATAIPTEIDAGLKATGVRRVPGEPRPQQIVRNAETGRILVERFGMIIAQSQPDAMPTQPFPKDRS